MITSFLKSLLLEGTIFWATHNPTVFNTFVAVSSLCFRLNDFGIVGHFFFILFKRQFFLKHRAQKKEIGTCLHTSETFRVFLNGELNAGAFLGIKPKIAHF